MKRNLRRWVPLMTVLVGLSLGLGAATYNSVDELPIPDIVISDRSGDAVDWVCGGNAPRGWYDLREIQGFITNDGIAFAVFCSGNIPSSDNGILLVVIDVDGRGGSFGRGGPTNARMFGVGYDYGVGPDGLWLIRSDNIDLQPDDTGSWVDGRVAYFEVSWDQLGGRPESVAVHAISLALAPSPIWDIAPNQRGAVLEIPAAAAPL